MNHRIENKKRVNAVALLFAFTYMVSYITRINYGVIISEMQTSTGFPKSLLSMALTGSFITYGIGQVISGVCGDKISPKKLVSYGLLVAALMNVCIPLCTNPYQMLVVWSVNGFAQSLMWPPMVKILAALLSEEDYKNAVTKVSWGSSFGTFVVYLFSPVLISMLGWKSVFFFAAVFGAVMIFIWNRFACDVSVERVEKKTEATKENIFFTPLMICIMLAIVLQGMLRDGVTTWMPSYIAETFHFSNEISILTGVILPVFSIICFQFAKKLYTKKITNPLFCASVFFGLGVLGSLGLSWFSAQNAAVSVIMFALLIGGMHSVNLMLICMIPMYFRDTGRVSTVSGVLNSCTYIGSAISTYGIALLSENCGWDVTIFIWLAIALCGMSICLACGKYWRR